MKKILKILQVMTLITILGILILKNINYANIIKTNVEVKYTAPILMKYGNIKINTPIVKVNINGKEYPVVGRVCMDQCMVKVDETVHTGDDVEIFGQHISLARMANELDTIPYEITCIISPRVEREYED